MTQQLSLERRLADLMADEAAGGAPEALVVDILAATGTRRQMPRWLAAIQEPPMTAHAQPVVGVARRQLVLVAAIGLLAVAVVVGAAALLLFRPATSDDWPGIRGDAGRSGHAATGPVGHPGIAWTFQANGAFHSAVAVAGDLVLVISDDGVLHALAIGDGAERWTSPGYSPTKGPFAVDGRVYAPLANGSVAAVDLATGRQIWASTAALQSPTDESVLDGRVYVGTIDGLMVALDAATGAELWRHAVSPANAPVHGPAAGNGIVIGAADDGYLTAFDAATGAVRWQVDASPDITGTPILGTNAVYLGAGVDAGTGRLAAFDLQTGAQRWQTVEGITGPAIRDGTGYAAGSLDGAVKAIDLATGSVMWSTQVGGRLRAPAVAGDVVYVSVDDAHQVVALDRVSGGRLWTFDVDGDNECCIAVARGLTFVATVSGTLYAVRGDGALLAVETGPVAATQPVTTAPPASASAFPPLLAATLDWAVDSGDPAFVPTGLARDASGNLWAAEGSRDRFSIFTADGTFVETWGKGGAGDGEFHLTRANGDPYGMIAFAPNGSFYVLDPGNRRIELFDADRSFVRAWGGFGADPGQFNDPVSIVVDGDGNVSVFDDQRQVIETFDPQGDVLKTIPAFPPEARPSSGANQLALGPNGHFYVSIVDPNEVIEIDREGAFVRAYGGGPPAANPFTEQPNVATFDARGRLYVTQGPLRGSRPGVVIFDTDGTYLGGFGALGKADDELGFAWGLVVTDDGIFVADAGANPDVGLSSLIRKFEPVALP